MPLTICCNCLAGGARRANAPQVAYKLGASAERRLALIADAALGVRAFGTQHSMSGTAPPAAAALSS